MTTGAGCFLVLVVCLVMVLVVEVVVDEDPFMQSLHLETAILSFSGVRFPLFLHSVLCLLSFCQTVHTLSPLK